jgi:hypothetical protein
MTLAELDAKIERDEQAKLKLLRDAARAILDNHKAFAELDIQEQANLMGRSQCEEYEGLLEEWHHRQEYEEDEGPTKQEPRSEDEIFEELTRCLEVRVIKSVEVLITTGGPAVRLMMHDVGRGRFDVDYQYQDWFKPWTSAKLRHLEQNALNDAFEHIAGHLVDELEGEN